MYARAEVSEQYKQAVRELILQRSDFNRGRMSGLATSLGCLGVSISEISEMCHICEEEVKDERAQEDVGPGDVSYDEEGFVIEKELDAIERPVSQAQIEESTETMMHDAQQPLANIRAEVHKTSEEDIYECEHCNAEFRESEILYREYGGEIGGITFCPRCKEETKLICITDITENKNVKTNTKTKRQ